MIVNKAAYILMIFCLAFIRMLGQSVDPKAAYVVDSILVVEDPAKGDDILSVDVSDLHIIRNKDSLKLLGYKKFDAVSFIFTKAYRARPDSIKAIPSLRSMQKKDGLWIFHGTPYTGRIINYYYSGRKLADGYLVNGKINGTETSYYQNGNKYSEIEFSEGHSDGIQRTYYPDGTLRQEGRTMAGKQEGPWKSYFPNGRVMFYENFRAGRFVDSLIAYNSNGIIRSIEVFDKNGKGSTDPRLREINQLMVNSKEKGKDGDEEGAIEDITEVIQLDSTYADAYFSRGTLKLNDLRFDEAIADFDKALAIEPFMEFALANRAFARIRKYQFSGSRSLSKNKDVEIRAASDKVDIPPADVENICSDLKKAVLLGDKSDMIKEALTNYCHLNMERL
jgi:antitoxin component YwqK of YwqJK toxin-antitoxin module